MKKIDNRGLNCPEPVLRTKKALEQHPEGVIAIVDNEAARENVIRMAKNEGFQVFRERVGSVDHLHITAGGSEAAQRRAPDQQGAGKASEQVLLIGADQLGRGSEELGLLLMRNYIYTLTKQEELPETVVFLNSGVKCCIEGSPAIDELAALQRRGVKILVCGTCLDYYHLKEKLAAGIVSNMYEIAEVLAAAPKVLSL